MQSNICCHGCGGRKLVAPLGGMMKDCAICNGIGYVLLTNDVNEAKAYLEIKPLPHEIKKDSKTDFRSKRERMKFVQGLRGNI